MITRYHLKPHPVEFVVVTEENAESGVIDEGSYCAAYDVRKLEAELVEAKRNPVDRLNEALVSEEEAVKDERQRIVTQVEGLIEKARNGRGSWEWVGTTTTAYRAVLALIQEETAL